MQIQIVSQGDWFMNMPNKKDLLQIGTWNRRYREMEALVNVSPAARALIVEVLEEFKKTKDLSFGERKMLDKARDYEGWLKQQQEKEQMVREHEAKLRRMNFQVVK